MPVYNNESYSFLLTLNHIEMRKYTFIAASVFSLGAVANGVNRPNIIYIFTDQQTASAMSCAGNPDVKTPNMDRLARAGVHFRNAYCTSPLSGPSRSSMFTGYYPSTIGTDVNGHPLPDSLQARTLGTLLTDNGYDCAYGGKWHVHETTIPDGKYGFKRIHPHSDTGLGEACVRYLSQKHDKPFFLVASFDNPHNICEYAREQNLPYGPVPEAPLRDCPGLPPNFEKNPYDADVINIEKAVNYGIYPTMNYSVEDWRKYRYAYFRLVEKVDKEIGKIVDAIDRYNLWSNTVVIFSSDHGDGAGAHRWNQKSALYEEVVNVPLIVTLPGRKNAGTTSERLINTGIDFFVSVCDWSGVKFPDSVPGISYRQTAEGAKESGKRNYIVMETRFDNSKTRGWTVRSERYKYVLYDKGKNREQLFDMQNDRGEMRNLMQETSYGHVAEEMRNVLYEWMNANHIRPTRPALHDVPGKSLGKLN